MFSLKIKNIKQETHIATQTDFLDVEIEILNEGEVVETQKYAFSIEASEQEIKDTLEKTRAVYQEDFDRGEANRASDETRAKAQEVAAKLIGATLAK